MGFCGTGPMGCAHLAVAEHGPRTTSNLSLFLAKRLPLRGRTSEKAQSRQKAGTRMTKTVSNSKRPRSMVNDKTQSCTAVSPE